jgi:hypothetical protein
MSVTIDLSADKLAQIKHLTGLDNDSEAATNAVREFLRVRQLRELKAASGKVDYEDVGQAMEALELREQCPRRISTCNISSASER